MKLPPTKHNIPVLVIFINSFIHASVSEKAASQHYSLTQFFQVFSHFAELGPVARLYLLKHNMIGRLLDFFYSKTSKFGEVFRDLHDPTISKSIFSVPLFVLDKPFYLEDAKDDSKLTYFEKRHIQDMQVQNPYMFLLRTVSIVKISFDLTRAACALSFFHGR